MNIGTIFQNSALWCNGNTIINYGYFLRVFPIYATNTANN